MTIISFAIQATILLLLFSGCNTKTEKSANSKTTDTTQVLEDKKDASRKIHILAKPDSVVIDVAKTALIVVDMENDFVSKGGMFDKAGIDVLGNQQIVEPIAKVLSVARQESVQVIYLKMGYHQDLSDLGEEGAYYRTQSISFMHVGDTMTAPNGSRSCILIRENWGTDIVPELKPIGNDIEIYKTRYSGFYQTNLDSTLKALGKKYLIFVGCTTSVCVESTVRDAAFRDYFPVVLEDCTAEPIGGNLPRSNKEASLLVIQEAPFGWVSDSKTFIQAISGHSEHTKLE